METTLTFYKGSRNVLTLMERSFFKQYNDSWGEWVDVSCPEICHMDKIKVVRLAEPHNQVCLLSFVVPCDFFSPGLVLNLPFRELIRSYLNYLGARCYSLEAMLLLTSLRF